MTHPSRRDVLAIGAAIPLAVAAPALATPEIDLGLYANPVDCMYIMAKKMADNIGAQVDTRAFAEAWVWAEEEITTA